MTYSPPEPVVTKRLKPVVVWVAVTSAPGSAPPDSSLTTPESCAMATVWALATAPRTRNTASNGRLRRIIKVAPLEKTRGRTMLCQGILSAKHVLLSIQVFMLVSPFGGVGAILGDCEKAAIITRARPREAHQGDRRSVLPPNRA